jgi:hypothetical protein
MHILAMVKQLRKDIPLSIAWAQALSVQFKPSEVAMLECHNGWRHVEPHILKISQKSQGHGLECGPSRITHHLCSSSQQHEHWYAITRETLTSYWRCIQRDGWIDIRHSKRTRAHILSTVSHMSETYKTTRIFTALTICRWAIRSVSCWAQSSLRSRKTH